MPELKYIRTENDQIVIFPGSISHNDMVVRYGLMFIQRIKSAGFCRVHADRIECYGESMSLCIDSDPSDSKLATIQVFGRTK